MIEWFKRRRKFKQYKRGWDFAFNMYGAHEFTIGQLEAIVPARQDDPGFKDAVTTIRMCLDYGKDLKNLGKTDPVELEVAIANKFSQLKNRFFEKQL